METHNGMCCAAPSDTGNLCPLGEICEAGQVTFDPADLLGCSSKCNSCVPNLLSPGILSQQLDVTQTMSGTVVLSGYSPGDSVFQFQYGDLVFGEYDATANEVNWEPIDGVPPGPTDGYYSPLGWRGGQYFSGDDVGRYSSIVSNGENLIISYEDTTHHSLKVSIRNAGTWSSHVVEDLDTSDSEAAVSGGALYTSIALDADKKPVIAYGVRVQALDANSQPHGYVNIARSMVELPTQTSDWEIITIEDTEVEIGCIQGDNLCHADATCVSVGARGHCVPSVGTGDCTSTCSSTQVCDSGTCAEKRTLGDLIDAQGLFNNLVRMADGFALVYYDRSVTKQIAMGTGAITRTGTGTMADPFLHGDEINGAGFSTSWLNKPIRIAGLPGQRSITAVTATKITFSGTPASANVAVAAFRVYDGPGGTIWGSHLLDAADWSAVKPFAIEGYQANLPAPPAGYVYGDCGGSATLFVDDMANWHVAFVDGTYERLRYVKIPAFAGAAPAAAIPNANRSTIDDGYPGVNHRPIDRPMLGGERRIVGDGASITVTSAGEIRVAYQDVTSIYAVNARCTTNCNRLPLACTTKANCTSISADSECNQGFCSNTSWVATALSELTDDTNFSPNEGYYTVQIVDILDTTSTFVVWLERALQPEPDLGTTNVVHLPATP